MDFALQYGNLTNPFLGSKHWTTILTLQHAGAWQYGSTFFFLDYLDDGGTDGFNDKDFYGEWYPTLSFGKLSGKQINLGVINDIGLIAGVNVGGDANVFKFLPGVRLSWSLPGFLFLNTDLTLYKDYSSGVPNGAPATDTGWVLDVNWHYPFTLGSQSFGIGGHAEYTSAVDDELNNALNGWILAQPQLTWDLSAIVGEGNHFLVGVEWQYWRNKLGTDNHDNVPQLLVVWRF